MTHRSLTPSRIRRALRVVGWNALLLAAGLALAAATVEVWLRLTSPFMSPSLPLHFFPGVGTLLKPNAEVRWTNRLDFWTVSRTNRLGFLDREPVSPERAAASCHIAMIGDSFVEAKEVPIADKSHIRLEELAARELPHLNVTTSAFGCTGTGQINQLPFYDEFARYPHPKLLVLVFVPNDFMDNSPVLDELDVGRDPERIPWVSAERNEDGSMTLRPPDPDWEFRLWRPWYMPMKDVVRTSYVANWLYAKRRSMFPSNAAHLITTAEILSRRTAYASLLDGWRPTARGSLHSMFRNENLPPVFEEALDFTAFALNQFKERADRDGVSLVILSVHLMRSRGEPPFDRLNAMVETRGIPVIDQYDYILRQGAEPRDARWAHDAHWNAAGHR